jgi:hypothetical protein
LSPIERVLSKLGDRVVRASAGTTFARCPAHEDTKASLAIKAGDDGRALLKCHAGCTNSDIVERLGLKLAELFADTGPKTKPKIAKAYAYRDERGRLLYEALRMEPKDFRQRRPAAGGGWDWSLGDVRRVLYRLPELLKSAPRAVWVVEGEKDADALVDLGLVATTNAGGAGKWRPEYTAALKGRRVFVLPDNDDPGRKHAQLVVESLAQVAASVRVIELPGLPIKGDVSDWLAAGGTRAELEKLAKAGPAKIGADEIRRRLAMLTSQIRELSEAIS